MMKRTDTPQPNRIAEAVTAYHAELYRFAALRTGSRSDAEDIVQEAFLKLLTASGEITHPRAYLYRCVANACCDLKRRRSFHEPLRPDQPQESPDPALREEAERLAAQLDRIPPEQAEAIRLHTFAALRFTEIAEILDIPVTTVKSRFQYGIEKLRNLL
ncbi:RNA polymerase sigma factor [uncultured Alistipes sp.]|mgnify:FL=1|uniref:RNA polymerase sigma factor n=1 Tax=uncultured Alistipes sp. TaxID=538949 RepID=UPI000E8FF33D|nr:RNA polymerase sigma factor [uncultured Alistipes sp.]HBL70695.1 RNA polymerase sigma factor [Alistipes sp.]HBW00920.1 RNA polymerase sigma factor [Alistipes sp.]